MDFFSDDDEDIWDDRIISHEVNTKAIKDFEDKVIDSTYAISPLKPLSHFLNLGTLIGVFPGESGERKIRFVLTFSIKIIWAILFSLLWLGFGAGIGTYCCLYNSTSSLTTAFQVSGSCKVFKREHRASSF